MGALGPLLSDLGSFLRDLEAVLGRSWGLLVRSWGLLRRSCELLGGLGLGVQELLGRPVGGLGLSRCDLGGYLAAT